MAAKLGRFTPKIQIIAPTTPNVSTDLDNFYLTLPPLSLGAGPQLGRYAFGQRPKVTARIDVAGTLGVFGIAPSEELFKSVIATPETLDYGVIVSTPIDRTLYLWNASKTPKTILGYSGLSELGLVIVGQSFPITLQPKQEIGLVIRASLEGPVNFGGSISFTVSGLNPVRATIIGTRIIRYFAPIPDYPVVERLSWLTDVMTSIDGTEQRVSVRGDSPRVLLENNFTLTTREEVREMAAALIAQKGRKRTIEYQYQTQVLADVVPTGSVINCNNLICDIRAGDKFTVQTPTEMTDLFCESATTTSITSVTMVNISIPVGSRISPSWDSYVGDSSQYSRPGVIDFAQGKMTMQMFKFRNVKRPGYAWNPRTYKSLPVLDRRPLIDGAQQSTIYSGSEVIDSNYGALNSVSRWEYSRIVSDLMFKVDRYTNPSEWDWFKAFIESCKGQLMPFWVPSFRQDMVVTSAVYVNDITLKIAGSDYAKTMFQNPTHRYIEITAKSGVTYHEITAAAVDGNESLITISPGIGIQTDDAIITNISMLIPSRLAEDDIELDHYSMYTLIKFKGRSTLI